MTEKYLPVGTIVLLKDANKKLMITGFGIIKPGSKKVYDYLCLITTKSRIFIIWDM